jgi:D-amino-acid oxidase
MFSNVFSGKVDFVKNNALARDTQLLLRNGFRNSKPKLAVVGGGIFGITSALELQKDFDVTLYETNHRFMSNASSINQYRIHRGYHYPRSKETAQSCKVGNDSFLKTYDCLSSTEVKNYYCIAKNGSKTSAEDYVKFLKSSGLEFRQSDLDLLKDENLSLSLEVVERLFDPDKLRKLAEDKMDENELSTIRGSTFTKEMKKYYDYVINCSYSNVNYILEDEQQFDCQFELCEKPVVKMPESYKGKSIVIMDGPFMCVDPYGSTENHVMGNVVHAIHCSNVGKFPIIPEKYKPLLNRAVIPAEDLVGITKFDNFIESAKPFFKEIESIKHIGSMFTIRTVLPMKEHDDSRPSLIKKHDEKVYTVFSGKIATCVDCARNLKETLLKQ